MYWVLDADGNTVPTNDAAAFGRLMRDPRRFLCQDRVGPFFVSTVFLGLDHRFIGDGPPILWETMIFTGDDSEPYQERYDSKEAALAGHDAAVARAELLVAKDAATRPESSPPENLP